MYYQHIYLVTFSITLIRLGGGLGVKTVIPFFLAFRWQGDIAEATVYIISLSCNNFGDKNEGLCILNFKESDIKLDMKSQY